MTVSYRQTPNPQEPEPHGPGVQQTQSSVARSGSDATENPQPLPPSIRRKVVGNPSVTPPIGVASNGQVGNNDEAKDQYSQYMTVPTAALNSSMAPAQRPAQFMQSSLHKNAQAFQSAEMTSAGQASLSQDVSQKPTSKYVATSQEIENGNIILYRSSNFFLRTAYRPGQKQNHLRKPTGNTIVTPKVMPHQETRMADSDTRLMPNVTLNTAKQTRAIPLPAWLEAILVVLGLATACVFHAYNIFNYPRYELDEGTYISNAWAITQGLISPYPYGYGHPPLAWMQIAAWMQLTGGPFTFGNALNSGRVFMLFYAVGSALLVYLIVRRWSGSRSAALLALIIFSLSPLSVTFQRQIYLDNVATFWLLLSLFFLAVSDSRLLFMVLAAISFGISVLSKEIMLLFLPAMLYAAALHTTRFQRKFNLVSFTYIVIAVCSGFVLMAVLKDELFPYAWHLPWDTHVHLSMLDTFVGQTQRGESNGSFITSWAAWLSLDRIFVVCSIAAPLFNLLHGLLSRWRLLLYGLLSLPPIRFSNRAYRKKLIARDAERIPDRHLLVSLLAITFWILLVRGGQVLSFYIIPLIPLIAMNVAIALNTILGWLGKVVRFDVVRAVLLIAVLVVLIPYDVRAMGVIMYQHPTSAQEQALVWVREHVPHNSFIVINSYMYLDLRVPGGQGVGDGAPYPHAEVYWNVAGDPELHQHALDNNPDRIDYIVADSEMLHDIQTVGGDMGIINDALHKSVLRAEFRADDQNLQIVIQVWQVIHKNPSPNVYANPPTGAGQASASTVTSRHNGVGIV
ncbi:MAG TPA: glycosyltransferase family 39 protein [Ktedonobacteraceae bacterium]|nr:glycosyltransferase family 39 protein [Ktedonobacteraceae bacterium]